MSAEGKTYLHKLAKEISGSCDRANELSKMECNSQIDHTAVTNIIRLLQKLIFIGYFESQKLCRDIIEDYLNGLLEEVAQNLEQQIYHALLYREESKTSPESFTSESKNMSNFQKAQEITQAFLKKIPTIREILVTDVDAAFDGDPAAYSKDEVILSYPGLYAIMVNRLAHELYIMNVPLIPRLMTEHAHSLTGIDIHPGARIGHHFFIDHGTGIVVGETTEIGNYVKMYQGVTLGALSTRGGQALRNKKRHPTVEDRVTIYSGASILGGETVIGADTVISSNAFVVKSVPGNTRVSVRNPELLIKGPYRQNLILEQGESWDK